MKAKLLDDAVPVFQHKDLQGPELERLPRDSIVDTALGLKHRRRPWRRVTTASGNCGFISSHVAVCKLSKVSLRDKKADVFESPSKKSPVVTQLKRGAVFYAGDVVTDGEDELVEIYDRSGTAGFVRGDVDIAELRERTKFERNLTITLVVASAVVLIPLLLSIQRSNSSIANLIAASLIWLLYVLVAYAIIEVCRRLFAAWRERYRRLPKANMAGSVVSIALLVIGIPGFLHGCGVHLAATNGTDSFAGAAAATANLLLLIVPGIYLWRRSRG